MTKILSGYTNDWIVIAAEGVHITEIRKQLEGKGKKPREDFFEMKNFLDHIFPIISMYKYGKLYTRLAQISVTERCTLKCKKCAHGCGMVDIEAQDMCIEDVFRSADSFFQNFDYITEFVLIGGEPLLYKQLHEVVEYIGTKYRDQMIIFSITTNGSIIPSEELMAVTKKYNVLYRISNYSKTIPGLKKQYDKVTDIFMKKKIEYRFEFNKEGAQWYDYGYEYVDRKNNEEELIRIFDECFTNCHEVRKNRYYFCVGARSASENLGFHVGEKDYFDLENYKNKMELFEYNMGYSEKGYLDMCNFCNGRDCVKYPIPIAEQL